VAKRTFPTPAFTDDVSGGELSLWSLQLGVRWRPAGSSAVRPYVDLAAGVERISANDAVIHYRDMFDTRGTYSVSFETRTKPGFSAGFGCCTGPEARPASSPTCTST
jgi:hypothetical protein